MRKIGCLRPAAWFLTLGVFLLTWTAPAVAEKKNLKFGADWAFYGVHAPFFVAQEKGFYKQQGLKVKMSRGYGSSGVLKELVAGTNDLGFGDAGATMLGRSKGFKAKLVGVMYEQAPFLIYSKKNSGITKPKDLEGKRIAMTAADVNKTLFKPFAKATGVDESKVTWVIVQPSAKLSTFLSGKADGTGFFVTLDPLMNKVTKKFGGYNRIMYSQHGVDIYSNAIVGIDKFIEANPGSVRGFMQALVKSYHFTFDHPEEATRILLKSQPHLNAKISRETIAVLKDVLVMTPAAKKNGIGYMTKEKMKRTRDIVLTAFGKNPCSVRLEDAYTNEFLK